ncbi:hypothetical protein ACKKBG_A08515 [Auxenochlorella protothecoides x Auxenochlorella symbiontica]
MLSAFFSPGLDGGEGSLQPVYILELVCTASATQDPTLRQAPQALARTLLCISMAVEDAAEDVCRACSRRAWVLCSMAHHAALSHLPFLYPLETTKSLQRVS